MSFKRLHYDLALKQEVIVYAERRGIRAAGCNLILLKQISVLEAMTEIPVLKKPSSLQDQRKGKEVILK